MNGTAQSGAFDNTTCTYLVQVAKTGPNRLGADEYEPMTGECSLADPITDPFASQQMNVCACSGTTRCHDRP
ncbi:hypothetical protein [Nonomuraea sp. SYSU D8015]|uniref:hypothetical protein n=1 Tax=Nonomuraea sp. SYSU D8015 TaxID=2593644 RepID=UPI0016600798|nr:hypothetical protein [Nonomuraea sp. SYSU D8015]